MWGESENGAYLAQSGLIGGTDFSRERLAALPRRKRHKRAKSGVLSGKRPSLHPRNPGNRERRVNVGAAAGSTPGRRAF
jgi:hypothetical protein